MKSNVYHIISSLFLFLLFSCGNEGQYVDKKSTVCDSVKVDKVISKDTVCAESGKCCSLRDRIPKSRYLRDPNKLHIAAGREMGLATPFRKNADFLAVRDSLLDNKILHYLADGEYYRKKEMENSYPYLTKEAIQLIQEISERFQANLEKKGQPNYSLFVTSALRTEESQRGLRRRNRNATRDTTSHLFGATFDISYWEFHRNCDSTIYRYKNLQNILTKTIREIRNEKKCLVIKETGHFCFHITALQ